MSNRTSRSDKTPESSKSRILLRLMAFVLILTVILFIAAGRWDWMMGWFYMAMYACITVVGVLVVPADPELVEERTRIKEGVKAWDKSSSASPPGRR